MELSKYYKSEKYMKVILKKCYSQEVDTSASANLQDTYSPKRK